MRNEFVERSWRRLGLEAVWGRPEGEGRWRVRGAGGGWGGGHTGVAFVVMSLGQGRARSRRERMPAVALRTSWCTSRWISCWSLAPWTRSYELAFSRITGETRSSCTLGWKVWMMASGFQDQ